MSHFGEKQTFRPDATNVRKRAEVDFSLMGEALLARFGKAAYTFVRARRDFVVVSFFRGKN